MSYNIGNQVYRSNVMEVHL